MTTTDKSSAIIKPAWAGSKQKRKPQDHKPKDRMSHEVSAKISIRDYLTKGGIK